MKLEIQVELCIFPKAFFPLRALLLPSAYIIPYLLYLLFIFHLPSIEYWLHKSGDFVIICIFTDIFQPPGIVPSTKQAFNKYLIKLGILTSLCVPLILRICSFFAFLFFLWSNFLAYKTLGIFHIVFFFPGRRHLYTVPLLHYHQHAAFTFSVLGSRVPRSPRAEFIHASRAPGFF